MSIEHQATPFDVCVVGHITRDWIRSGRGERCGVGGVAYYAALALRRLGHRVAVVTRVAARDRRELLGELETSGVAVHCRDSAETSTFHCTYSEPTRDARTLRVSAVAEPFSVADLDAVSARWFYLGPLTAQDMSVGFLRAAAARGDVALDAQGLVRQIEGEEVRCVRPAETSGFLQGVAVLKVDEREAAILSREDELKASLACLREFGPDEVVLTLGSRGSLVLDGVGYHAVGAVAGGIVDATGCGDTYLAAYLSRRLASDEPASAGRFAAAAAAMSLEGEGAFRGSEAEVRERMTRGGSGGGMLDGSSSRA